MQELIQDYEASRAALLGRIHEINDRLRQGGLRTKERERLTERRELLTGETIDMLHIINELRSRV